MKSTPSLTAAVTVVAALAGGILLAAEDRMLFEPQQATLASLVDDASLAAVAWGDERPARPTPLEARRAATRAGSGVQERR